MSRRTSTINSRNRTLINSGAQAVWRSLRAACGSQRDWEAFQLHLRRAQLRLGAPVVGGTLIFLASAGVLSASSALRGGAALASDIRPGPSAVIIRGGSG